MNCAFSVLLPFTCLAKRASTKTGITEKGNSYTIKIKKYSEKKTFYFAFTLIIDLCFLFYRIVMNSASIFIRIAYFVNRISYFSVERTAYSR